MNSNTIKRKTPYVIGLCLVVYGASLAGTMSARSMFAPQTQPQQDSPLGRWLDLDQETAQKIIDLEPHFAEELKGHQDELSAARTQLAAMLEDEHTTNDQIREQIEACITKHNILERRVAQYLLTVRDHLMPEQQKKLFRLCAEGVRKGHGRGMGAGNVYTGNGQRCDCCGRGGGGGMGRGMNGGMNGQHAGEHDGPNGGNHNGE